MSAKPVLKPLVMVYVGLRLGDKNKLYGAWVPIEEDDNDGRYLRWTRDQEKWYLPSGKKGVHGGTAGVVRKFDSSEEGGKVYIHGRGAHIGRWKNEDQCDEWIALSDTVEVAHKTQAWAIKDSKVNHLEKTLMPLRELYQKLNTRKDKAAFLANIITYIQKLDSRYE